MADRARAAAGSVIVAQLAAIVTLGVQTYEAHDQQQQATEALRLAHEAEQHRRELEAEERAALIRSCEAQVDAIHVATRDRDQASQTSYRGVLELLARCVAP
jgi:uncharacterized protein HemX